MVIRNKPTKQDIRLRAGMWPSIKSAQTELHKHGYKPRREANDLPVKFERMNYPALTIISDDNGKQYQIILYPSDAQIVADLPNRIENPTKISDRWDIGKHMKEGMIIDIDDKKFDGKK